jgi:hypothetical protein
MNFITFMYAWVVVSTKVGTYQPNNAFEGYRDSKPQDHQSHDLRIMIIYYYDWELWKFSTVIITLNFTIKWTPKKCRINVFELRQSVLTLLRTRFKSAIIGAGNNRGKEWKTEVGFLWIVEAVQRAAVKGVGAIENNEFFCSVDITQ